MSVQGVQNVLDERKAGGIPLGAPVVGPALWIYSIKAKTAESRSDDRRSQGWAIYNLQNQCLPRTREGGWVSKMFCCSAVSDWMPRIPLAEREHYTGTVMHTGCPECPSCLKTEKRYARRLSKVSESFENIESVVLSQYPKYLCGVSWRSFK